MAAPEDDDTMEFSSRHLPKRYHDAVNAKRRQRLRKRVLIVCAAGVLCIAIWFLLGWATGGASPGPAAAGSPAITTPAPAQTPSMVQTPVTSPKETAPSPSLSLARAQEIADRYVLEQNGERSLNMSRSWYEPAFGNTAGRYIFAYERVFGGYLTEVDGFEVSVDADTGDIISYSREWTTPDYAFSTYSLPEVSRLEATFAVMEEAQKRFPADVDTIRIISSEIRWKNALSYGTVPRPGSTPLAWNVICDDEVIRSDTSQKPAVAWVDVQSGELLAFDYRTK